jgi:branched-chain amino acid transport system substrate-binding protein
MNGRSRTSVFLGPEIGKNGPVDQRRRRLIQGVGAGAAALAFPGLLLGGGADAVGREIKIGFVGPVTGSLGNFGEGDAFVLAHVRKALEPGIVVKGKVHPVRIIEKDSESSAARAAELAEGLIKRDKVDLMLATSVTATVNPVSDQCEKNGVPCITTDCPWQAYFFGRGGKPETGFDWTYHFFWGLEDVVQVFTNMWHGIPTNKVVGALWPDDTDGHAFSDPDHGFPRPLAAQGFKLVDGGRVLPTQSDFSAQISKFKEANVEIVTGTLTTSTFAAFWTQAVQQGFKPKIATVAKGLLFPSAVETLGPQATGLTTEVWWSPSHPFKSGLTGQNTAEFCAQYEEECKRQWTQPIGFIHALFEVGIDTLRRSENIDSPAAIRDALRSTDYESIVGHIAWTGAPVKNVTRTPLVGGQWFPGREFKTWAHGREFKYDLVIVNNDSYPSIGQQEKLKPLQW